MTTSASTIEIALATDDNYAQHAAAVVASLLRHHPNRRLCINFLQPGAPGAPLQQLCSLATRGGAEVRLVGIPPQWAQRLEHHRYFGTHMWLRMLLPELLPELPRILYLDCDLVVNAPLDSLWDWDLQGRALGAVLNPLYPHQSDRWLQQLAIPGGRNHYFNSGVLLMDLARLRSTGATEALVRYAETHRDRIRFPDQDTLNAVLGQDWLPVPARFNAQSPVFELRSDELPFASAEVREARERPAIVHFSGMMKPWLDACGHPWRRLYWENLQHTPWSSARPQHPSWRNKLLRHLPYRWRQLIWKWLPQPEIKRQAVE